MKLTLTSILFFLFFSTAIYAQDSIVVYQKDAVMFSNRYVFFEDGTFKHFLFTDDMQEWYGRGKFIDEINKRTLYFLDADSTYTRDYGKLYYETNFIKTLIIRGKRFKSNDAYGTNKKYIVFEERK